MFPKLFELGPVTLHTYGLLLATALLLAISVTARLGEKDGIPRQRAWDLGLVVILSAVLGAKLLLVLTDLNFYLSDLSRLVSVEFLQAGGVYYGGLIGAVFGSWLFARRHPELRFWNLADAAAPAIALGQSVGRLGCFAAGCDYGSATTLPWAVTFTSEYAHQVVGVPLGVPLHPYQLYESFASILFFGVLYWAWHKRQFIGQIFCFYLVGYGVLRFSLEFFRGDLDRGFLFGGLLSTSQFISLLIVPAAVAAYLYLRPQVAGLASHSRRG